jgi:hypothetical protein
MSRSDSERVAVDEKLADHNAPHISRGQLVSGELKENVTISEEEL